MTRTWRLGITSCLLRLPNLSVLQLARLFGFPACCRRRSSSPGGFTYTRPKCHASNRSALLQRSAGMSAARVQQVIRFWRLLGGNLFGAHAIFDHADAFDLAADDIARLQKSLRRHEESDSGR